MVPSDERDPSAVDPGEDGENEIVERVLPGAGKEEKEANENCVFEIAKKRFNIDKDYEAAKLQKELESIKQAKELGLEDL